MNIIADITEHAIIHAAAESIDLTDWLFTLKDHEYQACSEAHIACGASVSEGGKRVSLNVEMISNNLLVQHYEEDIGERHHCRVNSISDSFPGSGRTKLGIIWELKVEGLTADSCTFSNRVIVSFTTEFLAMLENAGIFDLEPIKTGMHVNVAVHNREETPLFARDIEGKALAGKWLTLA
jgi:hypothetical protein